MASAESVSEEIGDEVSSSGRSDLVMSDESVDEVSPNSKSDILKYDETADEVSSGSKCDLLKCKCFAITSDKLSLDVRKQAIDIIHKLNKADAVVDGALGQCTSVLKEIEKELGQENIICELVAKEFAQCLRLLDLGNAVELITDRMKRRKMKDFGSLLTLAFIYQRSEEYTEAVDLCKQALKLANTSSDPLLQCLALVKQACNSWHMSNSDGATEDLSSCLDRLNSCSVFIEANQRTHRLLDLYKTLAYVHRNFLHDYPKAAEYLSKALAIAEKDEHAEMQRMKLESQLAQFYSNSKQPSKTETHSENAYTIIKELSENEEFLLHHPKEIIHGCSRIANALQTAQLENVKDKVLKIKEDAYAIGEKFLSKNHPEVARTAADIAYFCRLNDIPDKETIFIARAKEALGKLNTDAAYLKLHIREISDAWKTLALLYSRKQDFIEAEKCYNEILVLNTRVYGFYGMNHPRHAQLHIAIGQMYLKARKGSKALQSFRKCQEINEEFNLNDTSKLKKIKKLMSIARSMEKKQLHS